jgi:RNA polymerase-binding protein DksA
MAAEKKRKTMAKPSGVSVTGTARRPALKSVSKSAPKPRARKKPAPVEDEKPLVPDELDFFRQLLLQKRRQILGDVDHMRGGEDNSRQESTGDLSSMPIHMADVGTDNYEQEFTLGLIESERKVLQDIDRALAKIAEGTYGLCEGTGRPIGRARLEAKPEARYCIDYARQMEKGLAQGNNRDEEDFGRLDEGGDAEE